MKIKFLSLDTTSSLSLDVSQRLIYDALSGYFDKPEDFKRSNDPRTFLADLSEAFKNHDVVFVGAETSVYLATKKILAKALSLPTEVNENIRSLISVASSRTSEEERNEHATMPVGAIDLASDNGLFSGFAFNSGNQWLILVPLGTRKLEHILDTQLLSFMSDTLGLTSTKEVIKEETDSEYYEAITKGVFGLRQSESIAAFAATKPAAFVKDGCSKIPHAEDVVFFSDYYKDRETSDVKQYVIDLAIGARDSQEKVNYGVAISNVLKSEADNNGTYFMYVAIADEESAKVAKIYGEENEPAEKLVSSAISTAFSLLHEKAVHRFESKKSGADYSKKGAAELSTELERNTRKRKIGTAIRVTLALIGVGILAALYVWLFWG
ncbi:MAG: hypothetical protein IJM97_05420 [Clostridia bacterium]|nr:hypothetical protein [Clostridia bacterium]MBQ6708372.1 hypothetical protein [Clostridia bacterium]